MTQHLVLDWSGATMNAVVAGNKHIPCSEEILRPNIPWDIGFLDHDDADPVGLTGDAVQTLDPETDDQLLFNDLDEHIHTIDDPEVLAVVFRELLKAAILAMPYKPERLAVVLPFRWRQPHRAALRATLARDFPGIGLEVMVVDLLCVFAWWLHRGSDTAENLLFLDGRRETSSLVHLTHDGEGRGQIREIIDLDAAEMGDRAAVLEQLERIANQCTSAEIVVAGIEPDLVGMIDARIVQPESPVCSLIAEPDRDFVLLSAARLIEGDLGDRSPLKLTYPLGYGIRVDGGTLIPVIPPGTVGVRKGHRLLEITKRAATTSRQMTLELFGSVHPSSYAAPLGRLHWDTTHWADDVPCALLISLRLKGSDGVLEARSLGVNQLDMKTSSFSAPLMMD